VKNYFWKIFVVCIATAFSSQVFGNSTCDANDPLIIVSATDDGFYDETYSPEKTIDNILDPESRWSNESQGSAKSLLLDLGALQTLKSLNIAWYTGTRVIVANQRFQLKRQPMVKIFNPLFQSVNPVVQRLNWRPTSSNLFKHALSK